MEVGCFFNWLGGAELSGPRIALKADSGGGQQRAKMSGFDAACCTE